MSSYVIADPTVGFTPASATGTVQVAPLGYYARAVDNASVGTSVNRGAGQFVYCRGSNVTAIGQFVHISGGASGGVSAVLLASANSTVFWPIGVAAGNLSATNVFGWVQVQGLCDYATASNTAVAANAYIALGSTAGQVGTVTALGSRINGIAIPVAFTSSQTSLTCYLDFPKIIGVTASN
jgi:hypothetical protein